MQKTRNFAVCAMAALAGSGAVAQTFVDDFTMGEVDLFTRAPSGSTTVLAPSVLGGEREIEWLIRSNPLNTRLNFQTAFDDGSGLAFDAGSFMDAELTLIYDGEGTGEDAAGLDFDSTVDNVQGLLINTVFNDANVAIEVALTDGDGRTITLTQVLPETFGLNFVFFDFDSFSGDAGFNFAEIDRVEVVLNVDPTVSNPGLDLFVQSISFEIPSPGSAVLLTAGGLVAGLRRRR